MIEDNEQLLKQFFSEAAQQKIEDNGFTERVMRRLPMRVNWFTRLWTAFCILMALNVTFSNLWGIILREWKGCSKRTVTVLVIGLLVLIISSFLPGLLE